MNSLFDFAIAPPCGLPPVVHLHDEGFSKGPPSWFYFRHAHLKDARSKPLIAAIVVSWLIAFFEYSLQVPANRIGYGAFTLPQLKIIQEVITLVVFVPFAIIYMRVPITWNYLFAGICLFGAVFFIFRDQAPMQSHPAIEPNNSAEWGRRD